jgi:hypothetical protein
MLFILTASAFALPQTAINIEYSAGKTQFDFYRLADFSEQSGLSLTDEFSKYTDSIAFLDSLGSLDADKSRMLATTLEAVVLRDGVSPTYTALSDQNGKLSIGDIQKGVYLVIGQISRDGQFVYTPSPLIVSVPTRDINGQLQYSVSIIHNKVQKEELSDSPVKYKVIKVWKDSGTQKYRPTTLDVSLFKDGAHVQTVTLNAANNWSYEWTDLESGAHWTVVEKKVPEKYTMAVDKEQTSFYITNTYDTPPPPKLPSTGQLWWPIPPLVIVGAVSILLGLLRTKEV